MPIPKELTTITKTSRYLALLLFILLPILAFFIGKNYQSNLDATAQLNIQQTYQSIKTIKLLTQPSISASPAQSQDIPADWKTYTYQREGFSFHYPANWVFCKKSGPAEIFTLCGPNNFELGLYDYGPLSGSVADTVHYQEIVLIPNLKSLSLVQSGYGLNSNTIGLTDEKFSLNTKMSNGLHLTFKGKSSSTLSFDGSYYPPTDETMPQFAPAEFAAKEEVKTAAKILKSLTY